MPHSFVRASRSTSAQGRAATNKERKVAAGKGGVRTMLAERVSSAKDSESALPVVQKCKLLSYN